MTLLIGGIYEEKKRAILQRRFNVDLFTYFFIERKKHFQSIGKDLVVLSTEALMKK